MMNGLDSFSVIGIVQYSSCNYNDYNIFCHVTNISRIQLDIFICCCDVLLCDIYLFIHVYINWLVTVVVVVVVVVV